jgi:hypothetical protein
MGDTPHAMSPPARAKKHKKRRSKEHPTEEEMSFTRSLTAPQQDFVDIIRSTLPLMAAPMFLVSGPELVIACARAGIIGSYPRPTPATWTPCGNGWPTPATPSRPTVPAPRGPST